MYSVASYEQMIDDVVRMPAYAAALEATVKPGMAVADLGAGTGIFSLLACRFGARKVYAVEPNEALDVARMYAKANGFTDRIEFFPDLSTKVSLPEPVDLIVSDMRGVMPGSGSHLKAIIDARRRHLRPGGLLIPQRDTLYAAIVEAPAEPKSVWDRSRYDLDCGAADAILCNTVRRRMQSSVKPESLLTEPRVWCELDYHSLDSVHCEGRFEATALRSGAAEGWVVWFETVLTGSHGFSTGPGQPDSVYGLYCLPFPKGVRLEAGDRVEARIRSIRTAGDYEWYWDAVVRNRAGIVRTELQQSGFFSRPLTQRRLRKRAHNFQATLNEEGRLQKLILDALDAGVTLEEVAAKALEAFPASFESPADALAAVGEISERFSE